MKTKNGSGSPGTLGTFAGVFTPSILTILGIILFLRLGYVVGSAGFGRTLIILALANGISILTSISLSAIATNLKVKGGGDYYLISRTLGLEFGGAIGIVLFLAQSVSIAFYCIGLGEVVAALVAVQVKALPQMVAVLAVSILFVFAWLGADWATRFQYVVMAILFAALASFFIGGLARWDAVVFEQNFTVAAGGPGFWIIFAIFFPAVTGFTQGVSMSGDLKNAGKSLPLGTFLAVCVSIVIYFCAAFVFAGALPRDILINDYGAMKRIAAIGFFINAGVIAATLSSAMASFLGAPRILQSLAADRIFPFLLPFAKGSGPSGNPRRGVLLSTGIALGTIALGNLNFIAPVVSMFFLVSYGLLNYATYFEAHTASPSFRPRFKWYDFRLSFLGGLICLGAMLAINWAAGAIALAVLFAIYQYLQRSAGPARWADSRRSYHLQHAREHLLAAATEPEHPRSWRPQLLLFTGDARRRKQLLRFASWVAGRSGFATVAHILEGEGLKILKQKKEAESELREDIKATGVEGFPLVVATPNVLQAIHVLVQSFGIGPLHANTVLLNRLEENPFGAVQIQKSNYGIGLRTAFHLGCNLIILDAGEDKWQKLDLAAAGDRRIDVWWWGDATSRLMLLLAYIVTRREDWEDVPIRVLAVAPESESEKTDETLRQFLEEVRIEAALEVVVNPDADAVETKSSDAAIVFFPFRLKGNEVLGPFGNPAEDLLAHLPVCAMVLAAEDIDLEAEPEEGEAGDIAAALDRLSDAEKKAGEAEEDADKASRNADERLKEMMEVLVTKTKEEDLVQLREAALKAKEEAIKAARRAAKMMAKAENAAREAEHLGIKPTEKEEDVTQKEDQEKEGRS